jgi:hypothetical protein
VPEYNSAVMFRIPRWHQVTPVTGDRPRYSIFGWFLQPGQTYPLNTGEAPPSSEREVAGATKRRAGRRQQQQQQQQVGQEGPPVSKQQREGRRSAITKQQQQQQLGLQAAKPLKAASRGLAKSSKSGSKSSATRARQQHQQQLRQLHALVHAPLLKQGRHKVLGWDPCMLLVSAGGVASGSG